MAIVRVMLSMSLMLMSSPSCSSGLESWSSSDTKEGMAAPQSIAKGAIFCLGRWSVCASSVVVSHGPFCYQTTLFRLLGIGSMLVSSVRDLKLTIMAIHSDGGLECGGRTMQAGRREGLGVESRT